MTFIHPDKLKQIKAESLVTRAYVHYLIGLLYAQNMNYTSDGSHPGIVYCNRILVAGVDYPARETAAKTWELIQADLDDALLLFTSSSALGYGPDYSWFNKTNTKALYAKMALQMNDWQKAYDYADEVIATSGLMLTQKEELVSQWKDEVDPLSEVLLEFSAARDADGVIGSSVAGEFFNYVSATNYQEMVASGDLLTIYAENDIRKELFREVEIKTSVNNIEYMLPYYFTWKFQGEPGTLYLRLTEMYLIRAEALARTGTDDLDSALDDLNTIRERAGLGALDNTENLLEEIFLERRRELAFEGNLFFDIVRYQKDVERNEGCMSAVCNMSYPSDYFVLPIPEASVILNENMDQNDSY